MPKHPAWVREFLSDDDLASIARAVRQAEARTSAELRVHLDHTCESEALSRAIKVFERLGMHKTAARSGVLIYISVADHKLAVIGDKGIHERVGDAYWRELVDAVRARMRAQRSREGLEHAIAEVGRALGHHFPRRPDDKNELPDEVSLA
ncbi:MAG TPA: TPM domain-containing protein [Candidatus Bathyarchaeia archaeon]|nr:TPM domain-containing protein [Candidatus Bathyarchaeia archaeon]